VYFQKHIRTSCTLLPHLGTALPIHSQQFLTTSPSIIIPFINYPTLILRNNSQIPLQFPHHNTNQNSIYQQKKNRLLQQPRLKSHTPILARPQRSIGGCLVLSFFSVCWPSCHIFTQEVYCVSFRERQPPRCVFPRVLCDPTFSPLAE